MEAGERLNNQHAQCSKLVPASSKDAIANSTSILLPLHPRVMFVLQASSIQGEAVVALAAETSITKKVWAGGLMWNGQRSRDTGPATIHRNPKTPRIVQDVMQSNKANVNRSQLPLCGMECKQLRAVL